jgi:hypothetical protein
MLKEPRLTLWFEQDPAGPYRFLTRAEQRFVENQMLRQVKSVVPDRLIDALQNLGSTLFVVPKQGPEIELSPDDESMSEANVRLFIDQTLDRSSAELSGGEMLASNPNDPIEPICKIKVGGEHEDAAHCRLLLTQVQVVSGQKQRKTRPWIVTGKTKAGEIVQAWVAIEFAWKTKDPRP